MGKSGGTQWKSSWRHPDRFGEMAKSIKVAPGVLCCMLAICKGVSGGEASDENDFGQILPGLDETHPVMDWQLFEGKNEPPSGRWTWRKMWGDEDGNPLGPDWTLK